MEISKSLNIFISYGHVDNGTKWPVPEVVDIIKNELEKRHHNIFLDVKELPKASLTNWPDDDWRSRIYKEINNKSDNVIGFLSEKAMRQGGVCLDELSIAVANRGKRVVTVLLENQRNMKIPPTVSRIQWVDMSDWKSHFDYENGCFFLDGYFEEKFKEIVDRVEDENNFAYQYDINFLFKVLSPSNSVNTSLMDFLKKESDEDGNYIYENRPWLEDCILNFIEKEEKHYLLITGGPGYGKSQFIAHCIHNIEDVYAYYFIKYNRLDEKRDCNLFLRTLAFELAAKMPDYRSTLIDSIKLYPKFNEAKLDDVLSHFLKLSDLNLFDALFHCDTVHFINGDSKVIVVIDALDEAEQQGKNPIINLMIETKNEWPSFFKFIMTSRETGGVIQKFERLADDLQYVRLETEESEEDIANYLRKRLRQEDVDDDEFNVLIKKCEKTFIYAQLLIKSISEGYTNLKTIDDIEKLPKDYSGQLLYYFERVFPHEEYEKIKFPLGILTANGGSIRKDALEKIMRVNDKQWTARSFVLQMKSFVVNHGSSICFYHKAINDWLQSENSSEYYLDSAIYEDIIIDFCKRFVFDFSVIAEEENSTGFDLFEDAEENGFDYNTVKYVFNSCLRFLKKSERNKFKKKELAFLTLALWQAYRKSDFIFVNDVFEIIQKDAKNIHLYEKQDQFYIAVAYNIMAEVEIARDTHIPDDSSITKETVSADTCHSAIEYLWFITREFTDLQEYGKLYGSVIDNIAFSSRLLNKKDGKKSPESLNSAMIMLEDLQDFEESSKYEGYEISMAHLFYHKGIIAYDMQKYAEALEYLNESEEYIAKYDEDDEELGEGLLSLVLNQRAACYNRTNELKKSVEDIKRSLDLKTKIYGYYSSYVAVAYDNFARFTKDYETAQPNFSNLSDVVYDAVSRALEIKKLLFSDKGKSTARSYMTMVYCLEADKIYDQRVIDYVNKALEIDSKTYLTQALSVFGRGVEYCDSHGDETMKDVFEERLRPLK